MQITLKEWLKANGFATSSVHRRTHRRHRLWPAGGAPSLLLAMGVI